MSTNSNIKDSLIQHQIMLLRRSSGVNSELSAILEDMGSQIVKLANETSNADQLVAEITDIVESSISGYGEQLTESMEELAEYEAGFTQRLLIANSSAQFIMPSQPLLSAIVNNTVMQLAGNNGMQYLTIRQAIENFSSSLVRQISNAIRLDDSAANAVKTIKSIATNRTQSQAFALVRTVTNAVTSQSRSAVYAANDQYLDGLEWVSVLDSHTTIECADRDSSVYRRVGLQWQRTRPNGDVTIVNYEPVTPRHWNCRALLVPKVKAEFQINVTGGTRASVGGPVDSRTTFSGWMKRQPASFQDEFLGEARGKLYRSGGLSLDKFVDDQGVKYTLDELRALEPLAFERANL